MSLNRACNDGPFHLVVEERDSVQPGLRVLQLAGTARTLGVAIAEAGARL